MATLCAGDSKIRLTAAEASLSDLLVALEGNDGAPVSPPGDPAWVRAACDYMRIKKGKREPKIPEKLSMPFSHPDKWFVDSYRTPDLVDLAHLCNYLGLVPLSDLCAATVASRVIGKSPAEIKALFEV